MDICGTESKLSAGWQQAFFWAWVVSTLMAFILQLAAYANNLAYVVSLVSGCQRLSPYYDTSLPLYPTIVDATTAEADFYFEDWHIVPSQGFCPSSNPPQDETPQLTAAAAATHRSLSSSHQSSLDIPDAAPPAAAGTSSSSSTSPAESPSPVPAGTPPPNAGHSDRRNPRQVDLQRFRLPRLHLLRLRRKGGGQLGAEQHVAPARCARSQAGVQRRRTNRAAHDVQL